MSDILRYVTLDVGGRPSTLLDLNDMVAFSIARDSFSVNPASKQQIMSSADRRYGGSRQAGEVTDNGAIAWTALVAGAGADECLSKVEALFAQAEANPRGLLIEWRPDGSSRSSYFEPRGTALITPKYQWVAFAGASCFVVEVSIPVAPLVRGLPMDVLDIFAVDTRSDYSYDSGVAGNEEVTGSELKCAANASTENRAMHTARGYLYGDNQQTAKYTPGATITGWKGGVVLKRTATSTYIEVYVEDNGTNSVLKIDKVVAGVRANLASKNLEARVANATAHWVRGRIEGNFIRAEYFTTAPQPSKSPALAAEYTLAEGAERTAFGTDVTGNAGRVWIPKTIGASCDEYAVEPFTYRVFEQPAKLLLAGAIPGTAPASADVTITSGATEGLPLIWALLGWAPKVGGGLAQAPFGIIQAETASEPSGWSAAGELLRDNAASSAKTYTASWTVDPSLMAPDAFTSEVAIEVWARVVVGSGIVSPVLTLSTRPEDGTKFGASRYTDEWGSAGKLITSPSAGTLRRMVRLGTLRMLVDRLRPRRWTLWLEGPIGAGSAGEWGLDYLLLVPAASRACSPSSKVNDSTYPKFFSAGGTETSKTVYSNLSARTAKPPAFGHPDHGLGGQLIELAPGDNELLVKLSSRIPDDPTVDNTADAGFPFITAHAAVTPRWFLARSS